MEEKKIISTIKRVWPLFPAAIYLLMFLVIVFIYLFSIGFKIGDPEGASIQPLLNVLAMEEFRKALYNTFFFMLIGTPLELILGFILALLLYQSNSKIREYLKGLFIIPLAIPGLVLATLLFIVFDSHGGFINHILMGKYPFFPPVLSEAINWRGTRFFSLTLSLMGKVWRDVPISMLILFAGLNSIESQLFDAAKTMGATLKQRVFYVIIPLILPSISTVLLLRSIEMWKEFIFPYVLAGRYHLLGTLIESLYIDWNGKYDSEVALIALILVGCIILGGLFFIKVLQTVNKLLSDTGK